MRVRIKRIDKSLSLPEYQTSGSVGFDIYSRTDAVIKPGKIIFLPSNLIIEVPEGYFLMVAARSSLVKKGLMLGNSVGIIDQDYHGPKDEIITPVYNFTNQSVEIKQGERIAQGLILPIEKTEWEETEELETQNRGGFGSTGKN